MIFAELNGCPLQATISLTLSGFPSRGPHIPPPSLFHPLLHFHSMPLTTTDVMYGRIAPTQERPDAASFLPPHFVLKYNQYVRY